MLRLSHGWQFVGCLLAVAGTSIAEEPKIAVTLAPPRRSYLIGEPVPIDTIVKNVTKAPLRLHDFTYYGHEHIIGIQVQKEEGTPSRIVLGQLGCLEPAERLITPGETLSHPVNLLYSRMGVAGLGFPEPAPGAGGLVFKAPGIYHVKTVYPLMLVNESITHHVESNTLRIQIDEPTGIDREVWRQIQSVEILDFLQFVDDPLYSADRDALRLVEVLNAHPGSRYKSASEPAIRKYFQREEAKLGIQDRRKFRRVLGIQPPDLFPNVVGGELRPIESSRSESRPNPVFCVRSLRQAAL